MRFSDTLLTCSHKHDMVGLVVLSFDHVHDNLIKPTKRKDRKIQVEESFDNECTWNYKGNIVLQE